ncbi:MAG: sigma-54-dependent Fis family transcriptional regulator, partial [Gemmatimonadetes bacterium]|nr:sigma-54-dependent Fis family transcriptional regulator [Gemmatimonadota bacterium]
LVTHFVERLARTERVAPKEFTAEAVERLTTLDWPGNVRELRNTVERLLILSPGAAVEAKDVGQTLSGGGSHDGLPGGLLGIDTFSAFKDAAERAFILAKLRENDWNVSEAARKMDMPRSNLYKKIEKYELERD